MKKIIFMPIRLNSQRVKNKSIRLLNGRSLLNWSLESLDELNIPIYIYTNWINEIKENIDFKYKNINFMKRPKELDSHDTKGINIYRSFVNDIDSDLYLLTHCTSPFVTIKTYKSLIESVNDDFDSSLTVARIQKFCWYKDKPLNFENPRQKTQDLEPIFYETSAGYCFTKKVLIDFNSRSGMNTKKIETNLIESIDIDSEDDFKFAEGLLR